MTIEGITFNGYGATYPAGGNSAIIQTSEIDNFSVRDCILRNAGGHGIYSEDSNGQIRYNDISGMSEFGIMSKNSNAPVLIDQNMVTYSGNNGIYIFRTSKGSDQSVISNNQIGFTSANRGGTGPYGNAIIVYNADYVKIINNMIYTSAFSSIRANGSSNIIVDGNTSYNSKDVSIYIEAPSAEGYWYGVIVSNNRINVCGSGINATNSNYGSHWIQITGNQISNCSINEIPYSGGTYTTNGRGIYCESDGLIANNQIDTTAEWGIYIGPENNGSIGTQKVIGQVENNMIKNCPGGIAFLQTATLNGNLIGRLFIGGNTVYNYTTNTQFAAIASASYNGATGVVSKVSGATDLGNATSSGFTNVILTRNFSFN